MAQYTASIISYVDILGFKSLVDNAQDAEEIARKLRALRRHASTDEDVASLSGATFTNFSDLILRTTPVSVNPHNAGRGTLYWELNDLVHVQAELVRSKVLLRGAVTVGEIYVRDGITFGPGLIRAYDLESTLALYPRVIVDPLVFTAWQQIPGLRHHPYNEELAYLRQIVTRGADGVWFIDYLKAFRSEVDHEEDYVAFLEDHRNVITDALAGLQQLNGIAVKYGWLMNYHNRTVRSLDDNWLASMSASKNNLLVETNSLVLPLLEPHSED